MTATADSASVTYAASRQGDFALVLRKRILSLLRYGVAILVAIIIIFPFYWMTIASFKTVAETRKYPPTLIPQEFVGAQNYGEVFTKIDFLAYVRNSVFVSSAITFGALFSSSIAGYIFAKFEFRGRNPLFLMIVATMMIPFPVILIPIFLLVRSLGLYNTLWALIIPGLVTPWGIFLMRQYMLTVPSEMLDAARVDGASELVIFLRIVLPISRPALAAVGIFIFLYHWNDFLWPLVVIEATPLRTLPLGLARFSEGFGIARWNLVNAATVLTVLPVLIIFFFAQRQFIEGITLGSTKG